MTDNWTPSTEQVRSHYVFDQSNRWEPERGEAFDRWLNRVRAEALREAAVKAQEAFVDEQGGIGYARVRTDWLHAEANRIEQNSEGSGA